MQQEERDCVWFLREEGHELDGEGFGAVFDRECEVWEAVDAVFATSPDIMSIARRISEWKIAHQSHFSHVALALSNQSLVMPNLPLACSLSKVLGPILERCSSC